MRKKKMVSALLIFALLVTWTGAATALNELPSVLEIACEPTDIIQTADGSFLVTDAYYKVVLQIRDGVTSLYAGKPTRAGLYGEPVGGYRDSKSDVSTFRKPWAITAFANCYAVTDTNNNCVRFVSDEVTLTIAGGSFTDTEGLLQSTAWSSPTGLATDEKGDLYVSDTGNDRICSINHLNGEVTVVCTGLTEPTGLSWYNGTLYIAETGANRIQAWERETGLLTVIAGNGSADYQDGEAAEAAFAWPLGVEAAEDGSLYIADSGNCAIRVLKDGVVSTLLIADMDALDQYPSQPQGMLIADGILYVCDPFANKLYTIEVGK